MTSVRIASATLALTIVLAIGSCSRPSGNPTTTSAGNEPIPESAANPGAPAAEPSCHLVSEGFGPRGSVPVRADVVVNGLEVPWSIAFVPGGSDFLVSERPGRIRVVRGGRLSPEPSVLVPVAAESESGLLGIALHPQFPNVRHLFVYYTAKKGDRTVNRVARYVLDDALHATEDRVIADDIPASSRHDGGRLRFGPDGMLYVATGDGTEPEISQDAKSLGGKLLRFTGDGAVPRDNPHAGGAAFLTGIRNLQGFDWLEDGRIVLADHGPSGERGRRGHDEISIASAGQNLGWPGTWGCEKRRDVVTPLVVFSQAAPPGGAAYYRGDAIPDWKNSFLVGTLASKHLHRFVFDAERRRVARHEVYFEGDPPSGLGRLRDVVVAPDGSLYVTTSNCDGRGKCPPAKDAVLRIVPDTRAR